MGWCHEQYSQPCGRNYSLGDDLRGGCRMRTLEDLWYSNIDTADYGLPQNKEYKGLYQQSCDVEKTESYNEW